MWKTKNGQNMQNWSYWLRAMWFKTSWTHKNVQTVKLCTFRTSEKIKKHWMKLKVLKTSRLCPKEPLEIIERIELPPKPKCKGPHFEDEIKEDIDGQAVNALFGQFEDEKDSDSESEEEEEEDDEYNAVRRIESMFDDDDEPEFETKITYKSLNTFCFACGVCWTDGHVCDSSFKEDLCEILSQAEKKKIGSVADVPSIRSCPECCQLITHTEACKHMQCGRCKTDFCFVCLKPKKNGNWQCGSYSSKCKVAKPQNMHTLPDTVVLNKKTFQLF